MEECWGFLSPWFPALRKGLGSLLPPRINQVELWDSRRRGVRVYLPDSPRDHQILYEGLALLAAVAHADENGWKHLLVVCGGQPGDEEWGDDEQFVPQYSLVMNSKTSDFVKELVKFCGPRQEEYQSAHYLKALETIAAMDNRLWPDEVGLDLKVSVRVECGDEKITTRELVSVVMAEPILAKLWGNHTTSTALEPGKIRCSLVLQPTVVELIDDDDYTSEVVEEMEQAILNNVPFSKLAIGFCMEEIADREDLLAWNQLVARVLDSTRRYPVLASPRLYSEIDSDSDESCSYQIGAVHLHCYSEMQLANLFSAVVFNQTTKRLSVMFDLDDTTSMAELWKLVAYAVFSQRAQAYSVLTSLTLEGLPNMSAGDMELFSSILTSDYLEEDVFGCPQGAVNGRTAMLLGCSPIRWELDNDGLFSGNSRSISFPSPIPFVRTFGDDGESAWVNAVIPGYGRCHVHRRDLVFHSSDGTLRGTGQGLEALEISFDQEESPDTSGLPHFLSLVGSSLKVLRICAPKLDLDMNMVLQRCPALQELSVRGTVLDTRFTFPGLPAVSPRLPRLQMDSDDFLPNFLSLLNDGSSPFSIYLRQLRVLTDYVHSVNGVMTANGERIQRDVNLLLQMLETNNTLEYLHIVVPSSAYGRVSDAFNYHHLQPIHRPLELSLEFKTAFLSVVQSARKPQRKVNGTQHDHAPRSAASRLDTSVISQIFGYAAPAVLRQVYVGLRRKRLSEHFMTI